MKGIRVGVREVRRTTTIYTIYIPNNMHTQVQTRKAVAKEKDSKGGVFDLPIQMVVA